jgi:hypothetical protein
MKCFPVILSLLLLVTSYSQSNLKVMASAGRVAKNLNPLVFGPNYTMSYTVGEPFIYTGTLVSNKRFFNGFQQPDAMVPIGPGVVGQMPTQPIFKIYPNPFDSYSIIEAPKEYEEVELKLQLIDGNGKLVFEEIMTGARHKADYSSNLEPGTYFLNIYQINGEFLEQIKLIKIKQQ